MYEAKVYYQKQSILTTDYYGLIHKSETNFGDIIDCETHVTYKQNGSYEADGLFGNSYSWKRISSVEDFIEENSWDIFYDFLFFGVRDDNHITEEGKRDLQNKQWVLRFTETDYVSKMMSQEVSQEQKTRIGNVSLIYLSFETDGIVYNLGVIDNKMSGDGVPDNEHNLGLELGLTDRFYLLISLVLFLILLFILSPILPFFIKGIIFVVKIFIKFILWVLCLPFRFIKFIFKKRE